MVLYERPLGAPVPGAPELSVIIPTFREGGALGPVLDGLAAALDAARIDWEALVVDDASPDETQDVARAASERHAGRVRLIVREGERGLASAVVRGFREARGPLLAVMDADGQHPPAAVPAMVEAARLGADIVLGSRHVAGGSVGGFGAMRRLMSWGAASLARLALPPVRAARITDPMTGLFLVRRAAVDIDRLDPVGYKIVLEALAHARPTAALRVDVREVPYTFGARLAGDSKLGAGVMWDYLRHLIRLAWRDRENQRFLRFGLVGASGVAVNLGMLAAFDAAFGAEEGVGLLIAGLVARETSMIWNFGLNDILTFHDLKAVAGRRWWTRLLDYHVVGILSGLAYLVLLYLFKSLGMPLLAAGLLAIVLSFFANFRANRSWTYRARSER